MLRNMWTREINFLKRILQSCIRVMFMWGKGYYKNSLTHMASSDSSLFYFSELFICISQKLCIYCHTCQGSHLSNKNSIRYS